MDQSPGLSLTGIMTWMSNINYSSASWFQRQFSWTTVEVKASRWRHQMETFSAFLALCAGNSPVTGEFPHKGQWRGALMFSLICDLTKRFSKQSRGWWFGTPSRSLWRHCNDGRVIAPHSCMWMQLIIHALILMLVSLISVCKTGHRPCIFSKRKFHGIFPFQSHLNHNKLQPRARSTWSFWAVKSRYKKGIYVLRTQENILINIKINIVSADTCGRDTWLPFCRHHFRIYFLVSNLFYFYSNFSHIISRVQ